MAESFYQTKEREAAEKLAALLALPMPELDIDLGCEGYFDPWELFPCFYGSYSSAFDDMALTVLKNIRDKAYGGEELAHEMFRECLCTTGFCDYGTSPRACFPTVRFQELLPELIEKWEAYSVVKWAEVA